MSFKSVRLSKSKSCMRTMIATLTQKIGFVGHLVAMRQCAMNRNRKASTPRNPVSAANHDYVTRMTRERQRARPSLAAMNEARGFNVPSFRKRKDRRVTV